MHTGCDVISIIIPTLNEEKLILKTLSQFTPELKKKYKIEIIISDGGSTDNTLKVIGASADVIIKAEHGKKQNIPIGRNAGAKAAKGNFLYFFDADTLIQNTELFFEETTSALKDSGVAALTFKFLIFPDEEMLRDKLFHCFFNNYVYTLNRIGMGMGRGECQIVKKEYFEKAEGYNQNLSAGEDFDLYRRLKKLGKIKFLRNIIIFESPRRYRQRGYIKVLWQWTANAISVLFRNKSFSDKWEQVR